MATPDQPHANVNRGSELFLPLTSTLNLRIDEINFLFCNITALIFAFFFRNYINRSSASTTTRHLTVTILGMSIIAFCFGFNDLLNLLFISVIIFMIIRVSPEYCYHIVMLVAFGYLSYHHYLLLMYKNVDDYTRLINDLP